MKVVMETDISAEHKKNIDYLRWMEMGILCFLTFSIIWLVAVQNINWDEFFFLSQVHAYVNREPLGALQTFHVHLFKWLTKLPFDDVGQLLAARYVMVVLLAFTSIFVFLISRVFVGHHYALWGVVSYLSAGYVIGHGASFRTDPIAACFLMMSLYILFVKELRVHWLCLAALSGSIALLVTIKSVLFIPAFLGALIWRLKESRVFYKVSFVVGLSASLFMVMLYLHGASLVSNDAQMIGLASSAFKKTILNVNELWPRIAYIKLWALLSMGSLILVVFALITSRNRLLIVVILLLCPTLTIIVYRNAFPYFFAFITPTLAIVAAVGAKKLSSVPTVLFVVVMTMVVSSVAQFSYSMRYGQESQKELISVVKYLFPEPVSYIDRNSMIPSYSKVGIFMSSWGVERYREKGVPIFEGLISEHEPPLLIANSPALRAALYDGDAYNDCCGLLPEDIAALQENYIAYWGWIWVAGRHLRLTGQSETFSLTIAGEYRLESSHSLILNGTEVMPGDSIKLGRGVHTALSVQGGNALLVWNVQDRPPPIELGKSHIYAPFWSL